MEFQSISNLFVRVIDTTVRVKAFPYERLFIPTFVAILISTALQKVSAIIVYQFSSCIKLLLRRIKLF